MSRPFIIGLGLLLAAGVQGRGQSRREMESQLARLTAQMQALDSARTAYSDSMMRVDSRLESFDIGPIHVRTTAGLRPLVAHAAAMAGSTLERQLGTATYRLSKVTFFVRPDAAAELEGRNDLVTVGLIGADNREGWADDFGLTKEEIAKGFEERAMHELGLLVDPRFKRWSWGPIPIERMSARDWVDVRLHVVAQANDTSAACYKGDDKACRLGLHIDKPRLSELVRRYLEGIPVSARPSLVSKALEMGGVGAMERLLTTRGTTIQVLSATAGAPIDDVIAAWATSMRETRVGSATMSVSLASTSVLLMLACLGAAMRSPRWR